MKRWTFRIAMCLLLGVVTTVGVAWGLAVIIDPMDFWVGESTYVERMSFTWSINSVTTAGGKMISVHPIDADMWQGARTILIQKIGPVVDEDSIGAVVVLNGDSFNDARKGMELQFGWPRYAMFRAWVGDELVEFDDQLDIDPDFHPIPLRPILYGFLINTLFYAVIWFTLIVGGRAHMRMIRRWQGHCPMCNYDLRGDMERGCPECWWGREVS